MARKIIPQEEATEATESHVEGGVEFVKNRNVGEVIKFQDGTTHQFAKSRTVVTDPDLIDKLRQAASKPNNPYVIFEVAK